MSNVKIVGIERIQKKLKKNVRLDDVKRVVKSNGAEMKQKAKGMLKILKDIMKGNGLYLRLEH